ncbi:NADH-quinone oxidoreductase subunit NuoE [Desulfococcus sp.]|uniref:NADH-quinone oxidoreductase subunit NuoE n=1 Tax=Desulfococcus sp. TaxID=2025834 RepID=UPI0035932563
MPTDSLIESLEKEIRTVDHPRELAVDVMAAIQAREGYLSDAGVEEAARLLGMDPIEVEELSTFYTFIYREPVGRHVIHICDSVVCWMEGSETIGGHLMEKLGIHMGETTPDGRFTLLPVCCIGYCDRAPAVLINKKAYGPLTIALLDEIIDRLSKETE